MHKIIPVSDIPRKIVDCPTDNLVELYKVCQEMADICGKEDGIGLAASQIGIPWRLFVIKRNNYEYYVNCDYEPIGSDKGISFEGCLSLKDSGRFRRFKVERYNKIRVFGKRFDIEKLILEDIDFELSGDVYVVVFQHECDHNRGIIISDIGTELDIW